MGVPHPNRPPKVFFASTCSKPLIGHRPPPAYRDIGQSAGPHRVKGGVPRGNQGEKGATIRVRMARVFAPGGSTSWGGRSGWARHLILRHEKDQRLPGRHITDCQTRLGFLHPTSPHTMRDRLRAFHQGLKETGYVEGENAAIEYRENGVDRIK